MNPLGRERMKWFVDYTSRGREDSYRDKGDGGDKGND